MERGTGPANDRIGRNLPTLVAERHAGEVR